SGLRRPDPPRGVRATVTARRRGSCVDAHRLGTDRVPCGWLPLSVDARERPPLLASAPASDRERGLGRPQPPVPHPAGRGGARRTPPGARDFLPFPRPRAVPHRGRTERMTPPPAPLPLLAG